MPYAAVRIRQLRTAGDRPYTCAINMDELFRGMKPSEEPSVWRLLNGLRLAPLGRIQGNRLAVGGANLLVVV
jgi:hypothetical protein